MTRTKKLYFLMTYGGQQLRSFATKAAAIRTAAQYMREKDFVVVVCREFLADRQKDSIIWRPF